MFSSNPLIRRDSHKRTARGISRGMRKVVPVLTLCLIAIFAFASVASAMSEDELTFFKSAFNVMGIVIIVIGGGLALWGIVNLLEGYGNDNPGAKSQGMKQLMAGAGVILIGIVLVPALRDLFLNEGNNANKTT